MLHTKLHGSALFARFLFGEIYWRFFTKYEAILAYARDHGLTLTGFAYEKGVNELVIQRDEDYITQIEIPVQDPCSDGSSPRSHRTT